MARGGLDSHDRGWSPCASRRVFLQWRARLIVLRATEKIRTLPVECAGQGVSQVAIKGCFDIANHYIFTWYS